MNGDTFACTICDFSMPVVKGPYTRTQVVGDRGVTKIVVSKHGENVPYLCLNCLKQFVIDLPANEEECFECNSSNVNTGWGLWGKTCPICEVGTVEMYGLKSALSPEFPRKRTVSTEEPKELTETKPSHMQKSEEFAKNRLEIIERLKKGDLNDAHFIVNKSYHNKYLTDEDIEDVIKNPDSKLSKNFLNAIDNNNQPSLLKTFFFDRHSLATKEVFCKEITKKFKSVEKPSVINHLLRGRYYH